MDNKSPQRLGNSGENGMSMKEYNVVVRDTKEKEEVQELFEKLGYEKDFFMDLDYPRCVVTQERNDKWITTGMDAEYATGKRLTIRELQDMVHPQEKEYLNKTTGEYHKTAENVTGEQWVEIPEGANFATSYYGLDFWKSMDGDDYSKDAAFGWEKNDGHSLEDFLGSDSGVLILWQRHTLPEELPFIDDEDFVFTPSSQSRTASEIADSSLVHIKERATTYDQAAGERSAQKTAVAFNAITGHNVSEAEVFLLLQILKDVRQWSREEYHQDSAEDCIAYDSLKAEALEKELQNK